MAVSEVYTPTSELFKTSKKIFINGNKFRLVEINIIIDVVYFLQNIYHPLLLMQSGDIELNPGPIKFPCTVCGKPVSNNHRAISCDNCKDWTHIACGKIKGEDYNKVLNNINTNYICPRCLFKELPLLCLEVETRALEEQNNVHKHKTIIEKTLITELKKGINEFTFCIVNAQSCFTKINEINQFMLANKPTLLGISESWLNVDIPNDPLEIAGYTIIKRDRDIAKGGGLLLYIDSDINYDIVDNITTNSKSNMEYIMLKIYPDIGKHLLLILVYRPPNDNHYYDLLQEIVEKSIIEGMPTLITGDFNIDLNKNSELKRKYYELLDSHGFSQLIQNETRITETTKTLIDHCWSNDLAICNKVNLTLGFADHLMLYGKLHMKLEKKIKKKIKIRSFKKFNEIEFLDDLSKYPWHDLVMIDDINEQVETLNCFIIKCLDRHAPKREISKTRYHKKTPWMTSEIIEMIEEKKKMHLKALDLGGQWWTQWKKLKNIINHTLRQEKRIYYQKLLEENKQNPNLIWKQLRDLMGKRNNNSKELKISLDSINKYFANIGEPKIKTKPLVRLEEDSKEKEDIENLEVDLTSYIQNDLDDDTFNFKNISKTKIHSIINKLPNKSSIGYDEIGNKTLKLTSHIIEDFLVMIINKSLATGRIPRIWKLGLITPIHKEGDRSLPSNYRPIAVLSSMGKILEQVVAEQLYDYLEKNNKITKAQNGFRRGFSVQSALIEMTEKWIKNMCDGKLTVIIALDIKKAFDSMPHNILLEKLSEIGLDINTIIWFSDFLTNRENATRLRGEISLFEKCKYGVPQGSKLSPLLFTIFINDLPEILKFCEISLFADDITLSYAHQDPKLLMKNIEYDLKKVYRWMTLNGMEINEKKTKCMVLGTKKRKNNLLKKNPIKLSLNNIDIPLSSEIKILGVIIDESLNWNAHINKLIRKSTGTLFYILKFKHCLNEACLALLFNTLVLSRIDYCCLVYGSCGIVLKNKLQRIMNLAARKIVSGPLSYSSTKSMTLLGWKNLDLRRKFFCCTTIWKIVNHRGPKNLNDLFTEVKETHNYNTRQRDNLYITFRKFKSFSSSFGEYGKKVWNDIPLPIRQLSDLNTFKNKLKNYLT